MQNKITREKEKPIEFTDRGKYYVACVGECMLELVPDGYNKEEKPCLALGFAGDTLNTAVYLSRLFHNGPVSVRYVSSLGNDTISDEIEAFWKKENIDCQYTVRIHGKMPGLYITHRDNRGERSFSYWRNHSAAKLMFSGQGLTPEKLRQLALECNFLYLSGISIAVLDASGRRQLFQLAQMARENGARIVFDSNYRSALWISRDDAIKNIEKFVSLTDMALLTQEDEALLYGNPHIRDTLERYRHIPELVIKKGAGGCLVKAENKEWLVPAENISRVVDTTAAGDAFNAGYLAARITGIRPRDAAGMAHRLAGKVIQHSGAIIPVESMQDEIKRFQSLWTV